MWRCWPGCPFWQWTTRAEPSLRDACPPCPAVGWSPTYAELRLTTSHIFVHTKDLTQCLIWGRQAINMGYWPPKSKFTEWRGDGVFWGHQKRCLEGAWNSLGSYMYFVSRLGRDLVILDAALLPHIQSINKSCQLYFHNIPGIWPLFTTLADLGHLCPYLLMGLDSQRGILLLLLTPAAHSPLPPVLVQCVRPLVRVPQWLCMPLGKSHSSHHVHTPWASSSSLSDFSSYHSPLNSLHSICLLGPLLHLEPVYRLTYYMFYFLVVLLLLSPVVCKLWAGIFDSAFTTVSPILRTVRGT